MTIILESKDVRVEFGSLVAVRDLSFQLAGGELLGLVGPNGAGKTTLLRALAGLHAPTRGMAYIMGKPVLGKHEVVRQHVGFAPDAPPAYEELTIQQFLLFIARSYNIEPSDASERIDFWLEQLWLTEKRETLIKELSRGMRQRVTLARTFLPKPHVVLLDEPLSGLDPAGRIQLRGVLAMLRAQGCAMVVSSHILSDLEEIASHVAIIEHGSILRWTPIADIHHQENHRRTYHLTTLDDKPQYISVIEAIEGLTNLSHNGRTMQFDYHAEEDKAARLLYDLVNDGLPVIHFTVARKSLEEAYLKSGIKQVD